MISIHAGGKTKRCNLMVKFSGGTVIRLIRRLPTASWQLTVWNPIIRLIYFGNLEYSKICISSSFEQSGKALHELIDLELYLLIKGTFVNSKE
jgi:hypothetical protein